MWNISKNSSSEENFNTTLKQEFTETFELSKFELKQFASLCSDKCINNISVNCTSSSSYVIVALENKLSVFKADTQELFWELLYDSECDFVTVSDDLCLLLVVEKPGTLHLLHLLSSKTLWSSICEDNGSLCTVQNAFIHSHSSGSLSVYAFTEEYMFEISKIETSALYEALDDETFLEFFNDVHLQKTDLSNLCSDFTVKSSFKIFCQHSPLGLEVETKLGDFSFTDYYAIEDMVDGDLSYDYESSSEDRKFDFWDFSGYGKMKKITCTTDGRYIVCLDQNCVLLTFSSFTHLNITQWGDGDILSFVLYDTVDPETLSVTDCKIGILRKYVEGHIFEIRKFPSFEFVHKIQLSEFAQLVESKPNQDSWYIIEGNQLLDSEKSFLKVVSIRESSPEVRLLSLLNRRKFKEAEIYAKMCNLNDEIIYKTKINCLLKDSKNSVNFSKHDVEKLWECVEKSLNKIKDIEFIKSCISFIVPEVEIMKKFLSYISNWLVVNNIEGAENLICEINKNENKLITYNLLPDSIQSNLFVRDFLKMDLLQYIITTLTSGELNTAFIIWQRHKDELLISLRSEQVGEILNAVPFDIPSDIFIPLLREDLLPPILSKLPMAVDIVTDWIISRIHLLELTEKGLWPKNGNKLTTMFLEMIEALHQRAGKGGISYSTSISLSCIHNKLIDPNSQTGCLFELSKNLKLLINLEENFNCSISLTTFQDSKMDIIFAVLDRINVKYITKAISEFARPYALENDLDLEVCLELYIKNTLQTSYFTWWSCEEAPWEEPLTLVLECIHNSCHWKNAALLLLSHAKVPWSDRMKSIVKQGLKSEHSIKREFEDLPKQMHLKEILMKYEFKNFPMNNDLQLIYILVKYIFKLNKASALEDAKIAILSCCDSLTSESYKKFLMFFLNQNKLDELISLHSSIPSDMAIECSYLLLHYISSVLDDNFIIKEKKNITPTFLRAGIYFIEFLRTKKQSADPDLLRAFKCLQKLQKEFNIDATLKEITVKQNVLQILENFIRSFLDKESLTAQDKQSEKKCKSVSIGISKIKRLGSILGLDAANIVAILITHCLQKKMYDLVINLCGELISLYPSTQNAKTLLPVVNHFFQNFENIKNMSFKTIIDTVCHLSNVAVTYCDTEMIEECMYAVQLSTYFTLLNKLTGQLPFLLRANADIYHKWKFHPIYEDEGFQLDVAEVVDFTLKILPIFLRKSNNLELAVYFPLQEIFSIIFKPFITHLKDKGQGIAALRTMYLFYHSQMEFLQNKASTEEAFFLIAKDLKETTIQLMQRIIDKRKLDLELSIGVLSIFPNDKIQILKGLQKWAAKDLRCILSLGEIGTECCRVFEEPTECAEYDKMYRRSLLLLQHNVRSTQADIALTSTDSDFNWDVVKGIISSPKINLSTIFECCAAFDLVNDHVLIVYLNNLLIESEKLSLTSAEVPEEELQLILNRAKCAIEAITSDELIVKNLQSLLKKISSYSYEVLLFIHEQLLCTSANYLTVSSGQFEKTIALLNFLRVYERVLPPGEIELENWFNQNPTDMKLPLIAHKRLPFWSVSNNEIYKIINPELTADTLVVWLGMAPILKLSEDDLVMIAIKNEVLGYLQKLPTKHLILKQDQSLFSNIQTMLKNMSDPQLAVACASWVAKRMPPGGNKVFSCMLAVKFAEKWHELCPTERKPLDVLKKSTALQQHSAIEIILYQNNLADDISLSYANNPVQLVEYFIEKFCFSTESSIKVCKTVENIAKVVDINLKEIFCKFFLKWLNTAQSVSNNLDETFAFNNLTDDEESTGANDDENISRAINLLLGASTINLNICKIIGKDISDMTKIQRSRFIFCAVAVHGLQYVAESLNVTTTSIEELLPVVLYTAELESLHLLYSNEMVSTCNRMELVQSILSNQSKNPNVLLCCVRICLESNIWSSQVWDILLQRLVALNLIESLQDILQTAQGHLTHMWNFKSFISAWNSIISNSFKNEFTDASKFIEKVFKTILGCPCANNLDIESLWNDFKYFIKSINGKDLTDKEPVSDFTTFMQVLKSLRENR